MEARPPHQCPLPPVESDPNWCPPRPHVYLERPAGNGHQSTSGDLSPQIPPSPGLSYRTQSQLPSRSPSGKEPASSGGSGSHSRLKTPPAVIHTSDPYFKEEWGGGHYYCDVTMADGSIVTQPVTPGTTRQVHVEQSHARIKSQQQALESPTLPPPTVIPSHEIAWYPCVWRDGLCDGIYSDILTYMGWCRGELPTPAAQPAPMEGRPSTSALPTEPSADPIEQPVFEGPCWSNRVQQQQQRPDNVYGNDPFIDCLTDSQWEEIIAGRIPQPRSNPSAMEKGNLLCSYISCQPTTNLGTL